MNRGMQGLVRERGVALLVALVIVFVSLSAATALATRQRLDIERSANGFVRDAAQERTRALLQRAHLKLLETPPSGMETGFDLGAAGPGGAASILVSDLQARFNLNRLWRDNQIDPVAQARFGRLLDGLDLDATRITNAILDWLDSDGEARYPGGAEDAYYTRQRLGYRSANAPFVQVDELLLVRGIGQREFERLRPWVTALPADAGMNLNTMPEQLLATLHRDLTPVVISSLIDLRRRQPLRDAADLAEIPALAQLELPLDGLEVVSGYYAVTMAFDDDRSRHETRRLRVKHKRPQSQPQPGQEN